ncbi:hypothetical protein MANES_04G126412v8 [Manihot esculenta]|uniref:Uncharacterized protein n=1 Tax=Manihot esculenta TaxID=3983 RepID=A0ACB7HZV7_MANES|nr:hypothetical protein MANES_04G126412v8 [Manihot esculenta]
MAQQNIGIIRNLAYPSFGDFRPSVVRSRVNANNFELKPSLVQMNPHLHLSNFIEINNMIEINEVSEDAIRLRHFQFSLRDRAREWLNAFFPGSITTWEQLSQAFIKQYIPPSKTTKLRIELNSFIQREDESLHEAWERYKELQRKLQHFYNVVSPILRSAIDVAAGGDVMEIIEDEAYTCLDKIVYNNYHCNGERANVKSEAKKPAGMFEIDAMSMINAKFDALARRIDKMTMGMEAKNINAVNDMSYGASFAYDNQSWGQDFSAELLNYLGLSNRSKIRIFSSNFFLHNNTFLRHKIGDHRVPS